MKILSGKKILIIICGGIAAYKCLELIRSLKKEGCYIKTILTKSAEKFVTPLSVASLSQEKVYTELFDHNNESEMDHISLSRWADLILVAPATANTMSKISRGVADDLASTVLLASNKKIFISPAMNVRMWEHPSNKENVKILEGYGYKFIGPNIGEMACGEYGEGKMSEPSELLKNIKMYFQNINNNKNLKALVTAGPTQEYIDPVRYISNRSSGKQGYEIAKSLNENGFDTTLISGPTQLPHPTNVKTIQVNSAREMYDLTMKSLPVDVAVFSAAVSDYKVKETNNQKIKKKDFINLQLEKNIDILEHVSKHNSLRPRIVIGFAAETNEINENAKEKLSHKNCDWIVANDVSRDDIGFETDMNEVSIFYKNNKVEKLSKTTKSNIASQITRKIISSLN